MWPADYWFGFERCGEMWPEGRPRGTLSLGIPPATLPKNAIPRTFGLFRTRSPTPSLYGTCEGRNVALALVFDVCQSKGECLLEARRHTIRSTWYSLDSWCSIRITHSLTSAKILAFTSAPVVRFIMKPSLMPFSSAPLLRAYRRLTSSGFDPASWMIIELFCLMAI